MEGDSLAGKTCEVSLGGGMPVHGKGGLTFFPLQQGKRSDSPEKKGQGRKNRKIKTLLRKS